MFIRILARYLRPVAPKAALLALCLLVSIGIQLYIPQIIRAFIDLAAQKSAPELLGRMALTYLALAVANQLLSAAGSYLSADVGWTSTNALRADLFRHTLGLDMSYLKDRTPGEMIERIDGDVTSVSNFFAQFVVRVSAAVMLATGVLVLLWREDWRVGLIMTVFTMIAATILHWRREVAVPATTEERESTAQLFGFLEERLNGLDDIRANGAARYVMHRFLEVQRSWFAKAYKAWLLRSTIWLSMGILFAFGYVLTLGLGIGLFLSGAVTIGTVYLFFNYMAMLEAPLDQITQQLQEFQKAAAGLRRVSELLSVRSAITPGTKLLSSTTPHRLEFSNVRFRYAEQDVLKGVSFALEPGKTIGLLGRTGSGKTTLVRLLFRLYDASEGAVLLDGEDLKDTSLDSLRSRVGLVTQDVQLFQGSIRDNLTFFNGSVSEERTNKVLEELGILEWISGLPKGLDTMLDAGGSGLSAGEAQLLAFARVFLKDPGLVILDEPSSRLDPATERLMTRAVDRLLEHRTGVIIAHRLKTVERVDKIMILAGGQIVEFDDREQLARDPKSRYAALVRLSSEGALDESMEELG